MIGRIGLSALGVAGIGFGGYAAYRGTSSLFDRVMANRSPNDIENQHGILTPSMTNLYKGAFVDNMFMNIGAGLAGEYYGKRLISGGNLIPFWGKGPGTRGALGRFNTVDVPANIAKMSPMLGEVRPGAYTERDLARVARTNRFGSRAARTRLSQFGASERTLSQLKWGSRLRSIGRLAMWMPLAYMAFEGISSLAQLPIPDRNVMPRRTTSLGGTFLDTDTAYTQRKRALQTIHNSQYSGRAALGNEASLIMS